MGTEGQEEMRQSISLRFLQGEREREIDIQAEDTQQIRQTLEVVSEAEGLCRSFERPVFSLRRRRFINPFLSWREAGIYNGDIILLRDGSPDGGELWS